MSKSLTQVLELALLNGASLFAVLNPERVSDNRTHDDYYDVQPTTRPRLIAEWLSEVDDIVNVIIYDSEMRIMGQLACLDQDDWLVDCDTGDFTRVITEDV